MIEDVPAPEPWLGLIVEDQETTRHWLAEGLARAFPAIEIELAADLVSAKAWLARRRETRDGRLFKIALIDLGLPDGSGLDIISTLNTSFPDVLAIVATIYDDDGHLFDAITAGADGYLLKDQNTTSLVHYLRRIENGEPPLSPSIARRMLTHFRNAQPLKEAPDISLTPRETDVLRLIGRGLRVAEAARVLGISEHTVADYVKALYAKLNISSRAEAGLEAAKRGLT